jgi:hypothetical protein
MDSSFDILLGNAWLDCAAELFENGVYDFRINSNDFIWDADVSMQGPRFTPLL